MIRANFTDSGIVIGNNDNNLTYLYGLSDFFEVMFKDTSTINLLLEAESLVASEVYSRFLQMTSTLTLSGIQDATDSSLKLVFISNTDAVQGEVNTYRLADSIQSCKYVANKPFLPTELLDENVDYAVLQQSDGSSWIRFARPLTEYALPVRVLADGTQQYAMWFVNTVIDENLVSTHFGNLIGISPENASSKFSDFVYGLYYVYMYGPNLDTLARGLNLVLGIPVARAAETVLSIRQYLETDQYLVICDQNQYLVPYGLIPTVSEGDTLTVGQSLASWVELKDYHSDGNWWINLYIPPRLIPELPAGQKDRFAIAGSTYDFIMRSYLKAHTFLVKVNVSNFKNLQQYAQISDIVKRAKPAYAEAIYIWALTDTEQVNFKETFRHDYYASWDDNMHPCISRLRRDNDPTTGDPIIRGRRSFTRFSAGNQVNSLVGMDSYQSTYQATFADGIINGYINPISQFRTNTDLEAGWVNATMTRGNQVYRIARNKLGFFRGVAPVSANTGVVAPTENTSWNVDLTNRMVPLYATTLADISTKMASLGFPAPPSSQWFFEIFSPRSYSEAVDDVAINYLPPIYDPLALQKNYGFLMDRTTSVDYLGREFGTAALRKYLPAQTAVQPRDYLLCVRISAQVVGVYWVTSSQTVNAPAFFNFGQIDPLVITARMPASRGAGVNGSPYYASRGVRMTDYNTVNEGVNDVAINADPQRPSGYVSDAYQDKYNSTSVVVDRSKVSFVHAVEST